MRRNDREITDGNRIAEFIDREQILRIAFYDDGEIYIVPVNYGYLHKEQYTFYFHGARAGRKYELAKKNPTVGFEIDGNYRLLRGEAACDFSAAFQSVIGTGVLSLVEEQNEKRFALCTIMKQITSKAEWSYSEDMVSATAIFKLDVDKLSCKAKDIVY